MVRMFSLFTMAAWAAYHGVSAFLLSSASGDLLVFATGAGSAPALVALACAVLAGLHALAALGFCLEGDAVPAEAQGLAALAGGLALAAFGPGLGGDAPGLYALCVALTLAGFGFDRRFATHDPGEQEEADHRAFMRLAAEIGAQSGLRDRDGSERR